jgi:ATP-dependent DNA helicase RecG
MTSLKLKNNISSISGVGTVYQDRLSKLGIETIEDLIYHFPYKYLDRSSLTLIGDIRSSKSYNLKGEVKTISTRPAKSNPRMKLTEAVLEDQSGQVNVLWFNQPYLRESLSGKKVFLSGKVSWWHGEPTLVNPDYQLISNLNRQKKLIHIGRIVPVYPQTKGVSSKWLRTKIFNLIEQVKINDYLPEDLKQKYNLINLDQAFSQIHFPDSYQALRLAKKRLAFDELLITIIRADLKRESLLSKKAPGLNFFEKESKKFTNSLPFNLTSDQKRAAWQIINDLKEKKPMNRLLNGDVGSGKTIVATIAALNVSLSGYQTAIMAPTDVLAFQHYQKIKNQLKAFDIRVDIYTGSSKSIDLKNCSEEAQIVVGTQALIQEQAKLNKPGLVVVDEQQRFGVRQRHSLEEINESDWRPHLLTMTATPIPRTLAIAIYGDLNISLIKQKPINRKPVKTEIIKNDQEKKECYQFIKKNLDKGNQLFVVCPLIEENSETESERQSVKEVYRRLKSEEFADYKLDYLHGQMKSEEKKEKMKEFSKRGFDILITTSVIEIGVDVPKANIILIEGAESFGLSQLHQFRGRVGRRGEQAYCFLSPSDYSKKITQRLRVIESTNNGFEIAKQDLRLRGPGELIGNKQHGMADLQLATFFDFGLIKKVKNVSNELIEEGLDNYPKLSEKIIQFDQDIHLE